MDYYDRVMLEYYRVLNNAWKAEIKDAARRAIQMLSDLPRHEKLAKAHIDQLIEVIGSQLGDDFSAAVNQPTKAFMERNLRLGLRDAQVMVPARASVGLWGLEDQRLSNIVQQQQTFWVGNHFEADVRKGFADTLSTALAQGYTKEMLADALKAHFADLADKSSSYWQGLAEHTALRVREFGRLQGYKKAKAQYYRLVVILDDRTSDICRALAAQDKVYPLNTALDVMDNLQSLNTRSYSLDEARDYIKALAPWVKDDQVVYNDDDEPIGVSGAHTPFPPFHWRCRTTTEIVG
jgi:hypothetical protein